MFHVLVLGLSLLSAAPPPPPPPAAASAPSGQATQANRGDSSNSGSDGFFSGDDGFGDTGFERYVAADAPAVPSFPWMEHHGYFRTRTDYFNGLALGTFRTSMAPFGTSGAPPTLSDTASNAGKPGGDSVWSTNMRIRYEPTLHVTERVGLKLRLDILDDVVFGTSPDGWAPRNDLPMVAMSDGQAPPEGGPESFRDALRVKEAHLAWRTPLGRLRIGRMATHWGLGLLYNDGSDQDADFGDYVDRVEFTTKVMGTYFQASLDWISEGATSAAGDQPFGQPMDLEQQDDAEAWTFALFRRPTAREERAARRKVLDEERRPVLDYGLLFSYRYQDWTTERQGANGQGGYDQTSLPEAERSTTTGFDHHDFTMYRRGYAAYVLDPWVKIAYHPEAGTAYGLELEGVVRWGSMDNDSPDPSVDGESRDFIQWGFAGEGSYRNGSLELTLHFGAASGGGQRGFGVLDGPYLPGPGESGPSLLGQETLSFMFDRAYTVDMLLFREVVGTVTNAWYVEPRFEYDFVDAPGERMGFQLSLMFARAIHSETKRQPGEAAAIGYGTPSGDPNLGVELDAGLFFTQPGAFTLRVDYGGLLPMSGFDRLDSGGARTEADTAHTIQTRLVFEF